VGIRPAPFHLNRMRSFSKIAGLGRLLVCASLIVTSAAATRAHTARVNLLPKLHPGQTLSYHVSYHSEKHVTAESPAVSATSPADANVEVQFLLRLEILDVQPRGERSAVHARTHFEDLNSGANSKTPSAQPPYPHAQRQDSSNEFVEFTLLPDGRLDEVKGLDALSPEQQQAWQEWASRFALAAIFPGAVKIAEKVKSQEPEASPSPIAGLRWSRETTYVRNEPCGGVEITLEGDLASSNDKPDTCAVILTTATLKQRSAPQSATPEAFKVRELRTAGIARGTNRIITYISLKTGLVVRATEEANQSMDVTVATADGSNRVHYDVAAKSRSEVLLVSETPLTQP
jgi:hypothetical protein